MGQKIDMRRLPLMKTIPSDRDASRVRLILRRLPDNQAPQPNQAEGDRRKEQDVDPNHGDLVQERKTSEGGTEKCDFRGVGLHEKQFKDVTQFSR